MIPFLEKREVERVEVDGLVVVTAAGSSVFGKAALREQLRGIARRVFSEPDRAEEAEKPAPPTDAFEKGR